MLFASSVSRDGAKKVKIPSTTAHKRGGWEKDNLQKKNPIGVKATALGMN